MQPLDRNAIPKQRFIGNLREEQWLCRPAKRIRDPLRNVLRNDNFFNAFARFNELGGSDRWMYLKLAPFGLLVGFVVVIDVAQQQACRRIMYDRAKIAARPDRRPEYV